MNRRIEFELTPELWLEYINKVGGTFRARVRAVLYLSIPLWLEVIVLLIYRLEIGLGALIVAMSSLFLALGLCFFLAACRQDHVYSEEMKEQFATPERRRRECFFEEEIFTLKWVNGELHYRWSEFRELRRYENSWGLKFSTSGSIPIPIKALDSEQFKFLERKAIEANAKMIPTP